MDKIDYLTNKNLIQNIFKNNGWFKKALERRTTTYSKFDRGIKKNFKKIKVVELKRKIK